MGIGQIVKGTGLSRRWVIYCLESLEAKKILRIRRRRGRGRKNEINFLALNINVAEWLVQEKAPQYQKDLARRKLAHQKPKRRVVQEKA